MLRTAADRKYTSSATQAHEELPISSPRSHKTPYSTTLHRVHLKPRNNQQQPRAGYLAPKTPLRISSKFHDDVILVCIFLMYGMHMRMFHLNDPNLVRIQRLDGDHDLHRIPQRRLDQPTEGLVRVCRHLLREVAENAGQRLYNVSTTTERTDFARGWRRARGVLATAPSIPLCLVCRHKLGFHEAIKHPIYQKS